MVGGPLGIAGGPCGIVGGPFGIPPLTALACLPLTLFGFRLLTFRVDVFLPLEAISPPL
jgi:hypothetical protein